MTSLAIVFGFVVCWAAAYILGRTHGRPPAPTSSSGYSARLDTSGCGGCGAAICVLNCACHGSVCMACDNTLHPRDPKTHMRTFRGKPLF